MHSGGAVGRDRGTVLLAPIIGREKGEILFRKVYIVG